MKEGVLLMKRIVLLLTLAVLMAVLLGVSAPGVSASTDEVCNYGRMASNGAKAPGSMQAFTESSGPLTINQNQTNLPPGQEDKGLGGCSTE
jgi:hypothetical protein